MKQSEKLLYLENSFSQKLILLFIVGNTIFTIFYIKNMDVDAQLGVFVMLNIFLSLLAFLMAVRQKVYALVWGYAGIALAAFQIARWLWIPQEIAGIMRFFLMALLLLTGISALAGSLNCIRRSQERQSFIIENNIDLSIMQK